MTPKLILALCISLVICSCHPSGDLIYPNESSSIETLGEPGSILAQIVQNRSVIDTCMTITSTHWLTGSQVDLQPLEKANPEFGASALSPSTKYIIEANGDAMFEFLARGYSELRLLYDTHSRRLTGTLVTRFHFDEVLEMKPIQRLTLHSMARSFL